MRSAAILFASLLIAAPVTAQAQDKVRVAIGQDVSFTIDANGATITGTQVAGSPAPYETAMGAEFSRGAHADAMGPNGKPMTNDGTRPPAPVPATGKIRVRFTRVAGYNHSLLVIENGYRGALVYRAMIFMPDAKPTDVCLVMPGKVGVEHWPYPIAAIEMLQIRLIPWTPENGLVCE